MTDPIYRGEAWLKSWRDSSSGGRTITLQIDEDGTHPFKGYEGERFAIVIMPIGNDEKPMEKAPTPQSAGGVARAAALSPERRTEIASTAAKKRWGDLRPSARAALLVKDDAFLEFAQQHRSYDVNQCTNADDWLKKMCRVHSKREFDTNTDAEQFLDMLTGKYRSWQQAKGHQAA